MPKLCGAHLRMDSQLLFTLDLWASLAIAIMTTIKYFCVSHWNHSSKGHLYGNFGAEDNKWDLIRELSLEI